MFREKGLIDIMTIGERIKIQREINKLSEEQLASLLGVDCDYIVDIEANNKQPSYEVLPKLANLLKCSIDYLISGKESDLTIEAMDSRKRIQYFLDHDDAEGFLKYNYVQPKYIFSAHNLSNSRIGEGGLALLIRNRIYNEKLINIFNICLDKFIENKWIQQYGLTNRTKPIDAILENVDDYILMCCYANRIDGLECIDFKKRNAPVIAHRDKKTFTLVGDRVSYYDYSFETLEKIYKDSSILKTIKDYVFEVQFLRYNHRADKPTIFTCFDSITYIYYKNNDFKTLTKILEEATNFYKNGFDEVNFYRFDSVMKSAIKDLNAEWIKQINDFNKLFNLAYKNYYDNLNEWIKANGNYYGKGSLRSKSEIISIIDDEKIKYYEIKANPNTKPEVIMQLDYTKDLLLDLKTLFSDVLNKAQDANTTRNAINLLDTTVTKAVLNSPIYIYEFILMCLDNSSFDNLNKLFGNAYDKSIKPLIESKQYEKIKDFMRGTLPINILPEIYNFIKSGEVNSDLDNETRRALRCFKDYIPNTLERKFYLRKEIIKLQFDNVPLSCEIPSDPSIEDFKRIKETILNNIKEELLTKLESFTHHNELIERFNSTNEKYSSDKLLKYISFGESDIAVINLCSKLEIFIKAYFEFDGDFKDVLDQYLNKSNLNDDDISLLNKLRIKRNSIVHAENSNVEFSDEELTKAIILVEKLIKQEVSY